MLNPTPEQLRTITLKVNGTTHTAAIPVRKTLLDFVREDLMLTGSHAGCEHGVCGCCNVRLDGELVRSCILLAVQADGREVTTIEGLGTVNNMHPVQVVGGVSGTPMRLRRLEEALAGTKLAPPLITEAAELVKGEIDPQSDIHASAEYRRDVAAVLVRRALETARERAGVGVQEAG